MKDDASRFDPHAPPKGFLLEDQGPSDSNASLGPAPIWRRALAWLLDMILIIVLFVVMIVGLFAAAAASHDMNRLVLKWFDVAILVFLPLSTLWYSVLTTVSPLRATPGKRALRLRVCTAEGGRPPAPAVLAREVLKYPCLLLYAITHGADLTRDFALEQQHSKRLSYDVLTGTTVFLVRRRADRGPTFSP